MLSQFAQYYMMEGHDWGWGLAMMLFWLGIIFLLIVLVARGFNWNNTPAKHDEALDIAKRRYAKGEISKDEFEQLKKDLQ